MTTTTTTTYKGTGLGLSRNLILSRNPSLRSTSGAVAPDLLHLKSKAHDHLDRLWKRVPYDLRKRMRVGVYAWLRRETGMSRDDCHIAKFDRGMCEAVIMLCQQVEAGLIEGPRLPNGIKLKRSHAR